MKVNCSIYNTCLTHKDTNTNTNQLVMETKLLCATIKSTRVKVSRLNPSTLSRTPHQKKQICAKHDTLRVIERTHESHDSRVELTDSAADHSL